MASCLCSGHVRKSEDPTRKSWLLEKSVFLRSSRKANMGSSSNMFAFLCCANRYFNVSIYWSIYCHVRIIKADFIAGTLIHYVCKCIPYNSKCIIKIHWFSLVALLSYHSQWKPPRLWHRVGELSAQNSEQKKSNPTLQSSHFSWIRGRDFCDFPMCRERSDLTRWIHAINPEHLGNVAPAVATLLCQDAGKKTWIRSPGAAC